MSLDNFIRKKTLVKIGNKAHGFLSFDAALSESHTRKATITRNEIEDGSDITDHYRLENKQITIEGLISGVPTKSLQEDPTNLANTFIASKIGGLGAVITQVGKGVLSQRVLKDSEQKDVAALQQLESFMEKGSVLDVTTGLTVYKNMMIESVTIPRDAKIGNSLKFTISLSEVRMVESKTEPLKEQQVRSIVAHSSTKKSKLGEQKTKEPTEKETEKSSIAYGLFN